jgi:hypothetical protein
VNGQAGELPLEIVECRVERRACGLFARRKARLDLLERKRICAELNLSEPAERGLHRLLVAGDWCALSDAYMVFIAEFDPDDLYLVFSAS